MESYSFESTEAAQNFIYDFFIKAVKHKLPQEVLIDFEELFLHLQSTDTNEEVYEALLYLLDKGNEAEFSTTLKRLCYVLINNWYINRQHPFIQHLVNRLNQEKEDDSIAVNPTLNLLRTRLLKFLDGPDYQEIQQCAIAPRTSWSSRYTSYLLVPQFNDPGVSDEQKEFARNLSKQLKDKYKFDLAMYIARSESSKSSIKKQSNPTQLGDDVLNLIKRTISSQRLSNYSDQAKIFLKETQSLSYQEFKQSLPQYLMVHVSNQNPIRTLREQVCQRLDSLYKSHDAQDVTKGLILRTCNRIIEVLTTEDRETPSPTFTAFMAAGNALTLVILLLKVVLISNSTRTHLDLCVSKLIEYYQDYDEEHCKPLIYFLEVFNLVFTIFTENVQYHLVRVREEESATDFLNNSSSSPYRLFAQSKGLDLRKADLTRTNIRSLDLRGADLRDSDLRGIDLSEIDLRLANLSGANLTGVTLNESKLLIVNLNYANLNEAILIGTDLRRSDLRQANLTKANLESAKLDLAKLYQANLSHANLKSASLEGASLNQANLYYSNLQRANLSQADLSHVNLSYADLKGANLSEANLTGANLSGVDLSGANLKQAKLNQANLSHANLYRAELSYSSLKDANLADANLNWAVLEHAILDQANLSSVVFRHANLGHSSLCGANIRYADLTRVNLTQANLKDANLAYAQIRHTNLSQTNLVNTNLRGANLFGSNLLEAIVKSAKFGNNPGLSDEVKRQLKIDPPG
ncbi:MAG: pentapeptide repeat-containing protein [Microcoleaceae cyanobacterium]